MRKFTVLFLIFFSALSLCGQSGHKEEHALLEWNPFYKLQWDDFRGKPPAGSKGDAGTSVQIKAKPFMVRNKVHYDVTAMFNRTGSWARDRSRSLLKHEQLHFDIAELYARKIRQKVQQLQNASVNDIKVYNAAVKELLAESDSTDRQYDIETLHGALSGKQESWSTLVKEELEQLDAYKKPKRIIVN